MTLKSHWRCLSTKLRQQNYKINGHPLTQVEEEKDLGVMISSSCLPTRQVGIAAMKANQILGQLLRAFTYRDCHSFVKIYKQYVRLHLEYCVQAWSPWLQQDIDLLENVQRRALKAVSGLSGSYEEKLVALKMQSLQDRRVRGDMLQTFKLLKGIDNVNANTFFNLSAERHSHSTRQATVVSNDTNVATPALGLLKSSSKLALRSNFFSQRVVQPWNSLPLAIKQSDSTITFKNSYDKHFC